MDEIKLLEDKIQKQKYLLEDSIRLRRNVMTIIKDSFE
jgi:hypothetical protein